MTPPFDFECRVLVADDEPVNRQVAVHMLQKLNCQADTACSGQEAILMHAARAYDLLLLDCQMPQLDGYQATICIRAMENDSRRTPIIALTAGSAQAEREKCLAAGMDDFISKPIRPQLLKQVLARWLQPAAPGRCAAGATKGGCHLEAVQAMFGAGFAEVANLYCSDSTKRIASLRQAGTAGESLQVARIAHAFSGSCASIGADVLSALCRELELSAASGVPEDFEKRLAAIEVEYQRVSARLQSMMASA